MRVFQTQQVQARHGGSESASLSDSASASTSLSGSESASLSDSASASTSLVDQKVRVFQTQQVQARH